MSRTLQASLVAVLLLGVSTAAQAVIVFGPNGSGGYNAYERVDAQANFAGAITGSQVMLPSTFATVFNLTNTTGHLADFTGSTDYEFLASLRNASTIPGPFLTKLSPAAANVYIGLSDDSALATGAFENGNNSGGALAANGVAPVAGQRGAGWAFTTGTGLNTFNQRTPGVSIWGTGEPNNSGGAENAAELRTDGLLNDITGTTNNRPYVREWDLNLAEIPTPIRGTPGWVVTDIRNVGTVTNANYMGIAAAPPGTAYITTSYVPVINFGPGAARNFAGDLPFPQGGGDNFVTVFNGIIEIPKSGAWSFQMAQDDTIYFSIGTNGAPATFEDTGCCNTTYTTLMLDQGQYPIQVIFAEFGGGEDVELAAAFGANITDPAQFRLLGDTANGGLRILTSPPVPEPASAMLGLMGVGLIALRRRRRAA